MIEQARKIAKDCLRRCYGEYGIRTGSARDTYWSWDSYFASWGSLAIGDTETAKANLEANLRFQKPNGLLPRRISAPWLLYVLGFLTKRLRPKTKHPSYRAFLLLAESKFQNLAFIITAAKYLKRTGDRGFITDYITRIEKALEYLLGFCRKDGLLYEGIYQGWSETLMKKGAVLFSNVMLYKCLLDMDYMLRSIGRQEKYSKRAAKLKKTINSRFWLNNYYRDWIDGEKTFESFYLDGNLAAIIFGVADKKKSAAIQRQVEKLKGIPLPTNSPKYPLSKIFPMNWFFLRDYHNGLRWLWLGCLDAAAKHRIGMRKQARIQLQKIASTIVRFGQVYEIYENNGPFQRFYYNAEKDFAWSAGMFLWAAEVVR